MSHLVPFGNNRRQVARADEFDALDRHTRFEAAQIKADADLQRFRDLTEARLADQAMEHTTALINRAKQHLQDCPRSSLLPRTHHQELCRQRSQPSRREAVPVIPFLVI